MRSKKRESCSKSEGSVNPYYFLLLLLGLFSITLSHFILISREWTLSPVYFLTYAFGQSLLEVLLFFGVAKVVQRFFHKSFYYIFLSICFSCFVLHYVDFILVRFMDMSVFYALHWVFDESLENFIELLHITGIPVTTWAIVFTLTLVFIPLIATSLHTLTLKVVKRKPVHVSKGHLVKALCFIPLFLLTLDLTVAPQISNEDYYFYERALPWKSTFLSHEKALIECESPLKPLSNERIVLKEMHSCSLKPKKRPNICLFVVESLREDFLTGETAKNITQFREENIQFQKTFSGANATQISWYSIFHSNYPLYWAQAEKQWQSGSVPLQALKKMGYKLHVYSAAQLNYYGLNRVMFGKNHKLADSYHVFPHYSPTEAWESDQKAIETFITDLDEDWAEEGNVFVFFLESTHFNYSWPEDYPTHFSPVTEEKTHLRVSNSLKNIELIKNRYRNSIHYIDSLFGKAIGKLKERKLYDDAVIVFAGDHGEEFLEQGQLFHASHLSSMQTQPPIYYKLGDNSCAQAIDTENMVTSHIDIFPTILDYLVGDQSFYSHFHGESIFKEGRFPYVVSGRFNGPRRPDEFFIHDGVKKFTLRFFSKTQLELRRIQDAHDRILDFKSSDSMEVCKPVFEKLFQSHSG